MTSSETAASHWDAKYEAVTRSAWTQNPQVERAVYERMTGQHGFWLEWVFTQRLQPVGNLLSIGCGDGGHELLIARRRFAERTVAFDASPVAIGMAQSIAAAEGLPVNFSVNLFEAFVADPGPANQFDIVLFSGSLHHVTDLEGMLSAVRHVLKPGGRVIVNEYCGPCYQLYPDAQVQLIDRTLATLPEAFRAANHLPMPTIDTVMETDPTEGVRSALIPLLVPMYFEREYERFIGGGLLHPLFTCLNAGRVNDGSPESVILIETLILLEDELTRAGVLAHDFMFGIYLNR